MSKFTPGPWEVDPNDAFAVRAEIDDLEVCSTEYEDRPDEENVANARLISVAPELLKALQAMLPDGWDDGTMDHMPGVKQARLAIAKAGGRQ